MKVNDEVSCDEVSVNHAGICEVQTTSDELHPKSLTEDMFCRIQTFKGNSNLQMTKISAMLFSHQISTNLKR